MRKNYSKNNFVEHLSQYIGKTATIFTTSGGVSGQGFTGVIVSVNHSFIRLLIRPESSPDSTFGNGTFPNGNYRNSCYCSNNNTSSLPYTVGSVADIPIDRITSFIHSSV